MQNILLRMIFFTILMTLQAKVFCLDKLPFFSHIQPLFEQSSLLNQKIKHLNDSKRNHYEIYRLRKQILNQLKLSNAVEVFLKKRIINITYLIHKNLYLTNEERTFYENKRTQLKTLFNENSLMIIDLTISLEKLDDWEKTIQINELPSISVLALFLNKNPKFEFKLLPWEKIQVWSRLDKNEKEQLLSFILLAIIVGQFLKLLISKSVKNSSRLSFLFFIGFPILLSTFLYLSSLKDRYIEESFLFMLIRYSIILWSLEKISNYYIDTKFQPILYQRDVRQAMLWCIIGLFYNALLGIGFQTLFVPNYASLVALKIHVLTSSMILIGLHIYFTKTILVNKYRHPLGSPKWANYKTYIYFLIVLFFVIRILLSFNGEDQFSPLLLTRLITFFGIGYFCYLLALSLINIYTRLPPFLNKYGFDFLKVQTQSKLILFLIYLAILNRLMSIFFSLIGIDGDIYWQLKALIQHPIIIGKISFYPFNIFDGVLFYALMSLMGKLTIQKTNVFLKNTNSLDLNSVFDVAYKVYISIIVLIALNVIGIQMTTLNTIIAGVSMGITVGLKQIIVNFISGLFILINKPVKSNDMIRIKDDFGSEIDGYVQVSSLNSTELIGFNHAMVTIPNYLIFANPFDNFSYYQKLFRGYLSFNFINFTMLSLAELIIREEIEDPGTLKDLEITNCKIKKNAFQMSDGSNIFKLNISFKVNKLKNKEIHVEKIRDFVKGILFENEMPIL